MYLKIDEFKEFYRLIDKFVSKEAETFKFRFLMEAIYDRQFKEYTENMIKSMSESLEPEIIEKKLEDIREKCIDKLKRFVKEKSKEKKIDYMLSGLAYFCLLEAFNENSSFSEKIEKEILTDLGEKYLDILRIVDRNNLSKDVENRKIELDNEESLNENIYSYDCVKKYLIMKKWQDEQRSFSLENIRPLYLLEKEYINDNEENLMKLHRRTLIKRAKEMLKSLDIIPLELLSCYQIVGIIEELKCIIGGKACGLALLYAEGFNVPKTWIIPVGNTVSEKTIDNLNREGGYAVRSSADCEDGEKYSFAGIFESYLNVQYDELLKRIANVSESIKDNRVKKYLEIHNIQTPPRMAIIIQAYIEADNAGVWMGQTVNTGILEWCEGDGQKLVLGEINPNIETWKDNKKIYNVGQ